MADAAQMVPQEKVEQTKKWLLLKFREMLRGAKITTQITRWLSGELGDEYRFQTEIGLDGNAKDFIEDRKNGERLNLEKLD